MFCQHLFELRLGNALNLAQQFMRYLTNPKPAPQLICQVRHQTGSHLGICQGPVSTACYGEIGILNEGAEFVAWGQREESPRK